MVVFVFIVKKSIINSAYLFITNLCLMCNIYSMSNGNQYSVYSLKFQSAYAFTKDKEKLPENLPVPQELVSFLSLLKTINQGKYSPEVLSFFKNIIDGIADNSYINNLALISKAYGEARVNKNSELINKLLNYIEKYSENVDQFANIIKKLLTRRKSFIEKYTISCNAYGISDFSHFLGQWNNVSLGNDLEIALLYATAHNQTSILKLLLNQNVNVNSCDVTNWTALFYAVTNGYAHIVQLLINYNADINARDNNMSTPLHYAVLRGRTNIAKILLDSGANINAQDKYGSTPLMYAYLSRDENMVELLLTYKPNLNMVNNYNEGISDYKNSQDSFILNAINNLFRKS